MHRQENITVPSAQPAEVMPMGEPIQNNMQKIFA